MRHWSMCCDGWRNCDPVSCCTAFEKLKREAEAEDAKKAELWAQVNHLTSYMQHHSQ